MQIYQRHALLELVDRAAARGSVPSEFYHYEPCEYRQRARYDVGRSLGNQLLRRLQHVINQRPWREPRVLS